MPFASHLFRGDKKLEACAINDSAHLTLGARGAYVAKVQLALAAIDHLLIDRVETRDQFYGSSTAAAVLKYKTKRKIINYSYQRTPDSIVGKMTIARLDKDLAMWELTHNRRGDCSCSPTGGFVSGPASNTRSGFTATEIVGGQTSEQTSKPQLGHWLRITCAITQRALLDGGYPIKKHIELASNLLFEYGLWLTVEFKQNDFADVLNYPGTLDLPDSEIPILRKISEDTRPGHPSIFRIIVCPRHPQAPTGEVFRNISFGGQKFPPFAVLNSTIPHEDTSTMLHEMIHASYPAPVIHDQEKYSVFYDYTPDDSNPIPRHYLKEERARQLAKAFYAI